jgi:hypothetical protein
MTSTATRSERNILQLNHEAFEATVEMQIAMMEAASQWTRELTSFASRRAEATARDVARLTAATTPREVVNAQLDRMRGIVTDYSRETGRLLDLAGHAAREGGEGIRSAIPISDETVGS